jgi:hypothetical protein
MMNDDNLDKLVYYITIYQCHNKKTTLNWWLFTFTELLRGKARVLSFDNIIRNYGM